MPQSLRVYVETRYFEKPIWQKDKGWARSRAQKNDQTTHKSHPWIILRAYLAPAVWLPQQRRLEPKPPYNHRMNTPTESLIEYPSQFPIKVMGLKVEGYVQAVTHIAHQFDPAFDASTIELRESKGGKYLGVTVTVTATSREQLDELYRTLSTHPMVKVVL